MTINILPYLGVGQKKKGQILHPVIEIGIIQKLCPTDLSLFRELHNLSTSGVYSVRRA